MKDKVWKKWERLKQAMGPKKALGEILQYVSAKRARGRFKQLARLSGEVDVESGDWHGNLIDKFQPHFSSMDKMADAVAVEFEGAIETAAKMWRLGRHNKHAVKDDVWKKWEELKRMIGTEKALAEILQYVGADSARNHFEQIARLYDIRDVEVERRDRHGDLIDKFEPYFPSMDKMADEVAMGFGSMELEDAVEDTARLWDVRLSKEAAKGDIPNYREAQGNKKCGNCGAYKKNDDTTGTGYCEMFDAQVKADYTCDDWVEEYNEKESNKERQEIQEVQMAKRVAAKATRQEHRRNMKAVTIPDEPFYRAAQQAFENSDFPRLANTVGLKYKLETASEAFGADIIDWVFWPEKYNDIDDDFSLRILLDYEKEKLKVTFNRDLRGSAKAEMGRVSSSMPEPESTGEEELEKVISKKLVVLYSEVARKFN